MKLKGILMVVLIGFLGMNGFAMSGKEYLKRIQENYNQLESLSLEMNYILYKGLNGDSVVEQYKTHYYRLGEASYRRIDATEILTNNGVELTINHNEKQIVVGHAKKVSMVDVNLKKSLKMCRNVNVNSNGKNKRITLILKPETDIPYSSMTVEIDSKFFIKEITMNYASKINFAEDYREQDYDFPKLVIQYDRFKDKWKDKEGMLNTERFIQITTDGIQKNESFKNYQVFDMRN